MYLVAFCSFETVALLRKQTLTRILCEHCPISIHSAQLFNAASDSEGIRTVMCDNVHDLLCHFVCVQNVMCALVEAFMTGLHPEKAHITG